MSASWWEVVMKKALCSWTTEIWSNHFMKPPPNCHRWLRYRDWGCNQALAAGSLAVMRAVLLSFPSVMQEIAHILNNTQTANRNCFPTISLYMYSENKGLFYFILKAVLLSNVKWAAPIQKSLPVLRSHDHPWSLLWSKMNKCYKDLIVFLLHWDMWLWSV